MKITPIRTKSRGRWAKGTSGNPAGRPLGSRNNSTLWFEQQLNDAREPITRKFIAQAKAGHPAAMRLYMDRMCPVPRERPIQVDLPKATDSQGIAAGFSALRAKLSEGLLTPTEADVITRVLESMARVIDEDLQRRLERVEQAIERLQPTGGNPKTPPIPARTT
jgi:hypothetical protein